MAQTEPPPIPGGLFYGMTPLVRGWGQRRCRVLKDEVMCKVFRGEVRCREVLRGEVSCKEDVVVV